jgi:hypothetical protein
MNSKEHRKQLADALRLFRLYEKSKGFGSYLLWLKAESQRRRFIKSQARGLQKIIMAAQITGLHECGVELTSRPACVRGGDNH